MTESRPRDYLEQMRRAAKDATDFVEGIDEAEFLSDRRTQQAVVMSLIIIGEAASKLMIGHPEFASARPDFPWRAMRGMRNRIAHGYFEIDFHVVWSTVETALPELLARLASELDNPEDP